MDPEEPLCTTCLERRVRAAGECMTCYLYRRRTGGQRPWSVISANFQRRADGRGVSLEILAELRDTSVQMGRWDLCGVCGTLDRWAEGEAMPLCQMHRGWLALAGLVLDEPDDVMWLVDAVSA